MKQSREWAFVRPAAFVLFFTAYLTFPAFGRSNENDSGFIFHYAKPPSFKAKAVYSLLKASGLKKIMARERDSSKGRPNIGLPGPPADVMQGLRVVVQRVKGHNVFTISPKNSGNGKYIIYLHGGAFVLTFIKPHWQFIAQLVSQTGCTVVAADYPLSPPNSYKERFEVMEPVYIMLEKKAGAQNLILMGDSAGGNIALALAQKMKVAGIATPQQIILISPWLDVSMTNPRINQVDDRDPLLPVKGSAIIGKIHAGNLGMKHFLVSPLYGDLSGIGRISIFTGTYDILNPDAQKLRGLAVRQHVPLRFYEYDRMIHTWVLLDMPEAYKARRQIIELVNK